MTITKNVDAETIIRAENDKIRAELVNIGEGLSGDYDPEDPEDINLLRFDVYFKDPTQSENWEAVDDASYCTNIPADASEEILEKAVTAIFDEYNNVAEHILSGGSVKKMGEQLSHISPEDFEEKEKD